ncbi:N-acetylaspartate synthetase-like [Exaiptasia diaphana]|uniref:N-acetyltransferase domain-containing protein n=1 Tax=Exaiptasia diaphana TaxID=2652724 RepID=A0A913YC36_EXADI|nr:N-acetylaspartate synthetase-like [Exaiptasia diaphana]
MTVTLATGVKVMYPEDIVNYKRASPKRTQTSFNIRPFQVADTKTIQDVYLEAHNSFIFPAFEAGLQKPYINVPALLFVHCLTTITESLYIGIGLLFILVVGVYLSYRVKFMNHLNHSMTTDLHDIENFYQCGSDESSFWVAEIAGKVVGFVGMKQRDSTTIELQRLTVAPQYRRRGIGESLCRNVISFYKRKKFQQLILECTEVHFAGKSLYAKLGFNIDERIAAPFALSAITLEHYSLNLT